MALTIAVLFQTEKRSRFPMDRVFNNLQFADVAVSSRAGISWVVAFAVFLHVPNWESVGAAVSYG
jgi:hypothetical protein